MARVNVFIVSFILLRLRCNGSRRRTRKNTSAGCRILRCPPNDDCNPNGSRSSQWATPGVRLTPTKWRGRFLNGRFDHPPRLLRLQDRRNAADERGDAERVRIRG
jgi:hypothetical protein